MSDEEKTASFRHAETARLHRDLASRRPTSPAEDEQPAVDDALIAELSQITARRRERTVDSETRLFDEEPTAAHALAAAPPQSDELAGGAQTHLLVQLADEANAASSTRRAALLLYELGRMYETELLQHDRALDCFRAGFQRCPELALNTRALARLLIRRGDVAEAVTVMQKELDATTNAGDRAAILATIGELRMHHQGDLAGAQKALEQARELDRDDPVATDLLFEVHVQQRSWEEAAALLREQLGNCDDEAWRSVLCCEAARLHEQHLGEPRAAASLYRMALDADPTNDQALRALLRHARAIDDYGSVARLCESLATLEHGPAAATLLWEAAHVYEVRLHSSGLATAALERACELAPKELTLWLDLARCYEAERRWEDLARALQAALDLADAPARAALVAERLGRLQAERLGRTEAALETLGAAVKLAPTHLGPRSMLGRLYQRLGRHQDLAGLLELELELYEEPALRAATAYRLGHLWESQLDDLEQALPFYQQALEHVPGYRPAIRALGRVFRARQQYDRVVEVYRRELAASQGQAERLLLLRRIAELCEQRLDDRQGSIAAYRELLELEPSNVPALRALYRLCAPGEQWQELIDALRNESDQTLDRWQRVALLFEIGWLQQQALGQPDEALSTYLEVLDHTPDYQPALIAAGAMLARDGRWDEVAEMHRQELAVTEHPDHRAWLLQKLGRLYAEQLQMQDEAIDAYAEAAKLAEHPRPATDQLERLLAIRGDRQRLATLLAARPAPPSPSARALHHRRIGRLLLALGHEQQATEQLRRALRAEHDEASLHMLARLYRQTDARPSLIKLLRTELGRADGKHARLAAMHKLARMWTQSDHDLHHAAEIYLRVLDLTPNDRLVLRQLEALFARLEQWDDLAAVLALAQDLSDDADYRVACAQVIAALREDRLGDLAGATQSALEVSARYPANPEALATLERHARATCNSDELLHALGHQLKAGQSRAEQAATLCALAATRAKRSEPTHAEELYRLATEVMPSYLPAARGWARAAAELDDTRKVACARELEAEATLLAGRRVACMLEAADAFDAAGEPERAIGALHRVLELEPTEPRAIRTLQGLLSARNDHARLIQLYEHRIRHTPDAKERHHLLARVADVQRRRMRDIPAARETIARALELFPDDPQLLSTLADLCRQSGDWQGLASVAQRLTEVLDDRTLVKAHHFELGMLCEEKLARPSDAVFHYRQVLELDPDDLGALTRLSALLHAQQQWRDAAAVTERLVQRDDDRRRVKRFQLRLSEIYARGFGDFDRARAACLRALALDPGDSQASEAMADLLEHQRDLRALHAHLESTLTVHRARIERAPFALYSYKALLKIFHRQGADDHHFVVCSLLDALDLASEEQHREVDRLRSLAPSFPRRPLTTEEVERVVCHPSERGPFARVLALAAPAMRKVFGKAERPVGKTVKITQRTHPELSAILRAYNRALGDGPLTQLFAEEGGEPMEILDTQPPTLLVRPELLRLADAELRFVLARAVASARLGHLLAHRLGAEQLAAAIAAVIGNARTGYQPPLPPEVIDPLIAKVNKTLSRRMRGELQVPALELSEQPLDGAHWLEALALSEDRAALTLCGDIWAAIRIVAAEEGLELAGALSAEQLASPAGPRTRGLLLFAVSEEYLTLRARLGMSISEL